MIHKFTVRIGPARDITEIDGRIEISRQFSEWLNDNQNANIAAFEVSIDKSLVYTVRQTNITEYYYVVDAVGVVVYNDSEEEENTNSLAMSV